MHRTPLNRRAGKYNPDWFAASILGDSLGLVQGAYCSGNLMATIVRHVDPAAGEALGLVNTSRSTLDPTAIARRFQVREVASVPW